MNSRGNETRYDGAAAQIDRARKVGEATGVFLEYKKFCITCKRDRPARGGRVIRGMTSGFQKCAECLAEGAK